MRVIDPRDRDLSLELEIGVISSGSPGSYFDPPEGPELEIAAIYEEGADEPIPLKDYKRVFTAKQMEEIETQMYEKWEPEEEA